MRATTTLITVALALALASPQLSAQVAPDPAPVKAIVPAPPADVDPDANANADPQPEGKKLTITIKAVRGSVKRKHLAAANPAWQPVKVGDTLDEMTIIITGFRSEVTIEFGDNSVLVIESSTQIGIAHCRKTTRLTRTEVNLKYGAIRPTIHKAKGPNDYRVVTPVATLAAIGTSGRILYGVTRGLMLSGRTGIWVIIRHYSRKNVKAGELSDGMRNSSEIKKILADLRTTNASGGLSAVERRLLNLRGSGNDFLLFTDHTRRMQRVLQASYKVGVSR